MWKLSMVFEPQAWPFLRSASVQRIGFQSGARIRRASRGSDIVFRGNGDRFLVFLPNSGSADASLVAERIRTCAHAESFKYRTIDIDLTMSIGVVTVSSKDTRFKLAERADRAVFHAKILGKDRVHVDNSADKLAQSVFS